MFLYCLYPKVQFLLVIKIFEALKNKNNLDKKDENKEVTVFQLFYTFISHFTFHGGICGLLFLLFWYYFCLFSLGLTQNTPLFEYFWAIANISTIYVVTCIATLVGFLYISEHHKGQIIK